MQGYCNLVMYISKMDIVVEDITSIQPNRSKFIYHQHETRNLL